MAIKSATQEDLKTMELRINKEQTDLRHSDRNKMQSVIDEVDDIKVNNALLTQSLTAMKSEITEMKNDVRSIRSDLQNFEKNLFEKLDKRYASKLSENILYGMVGTIVGSFILALVSFVIK